jgi:DNA-binding response OmpR family regulator
MSKTYGKGVTILVAEDDTQIRRHVTSLLEEKGYRVLAADGGDTAMELSRRHSGRIHLLLTDIQMSGTLDGFSLAQQICRERPGIRILTMSGNYWEMFGLPMLTKPFTAHGLYVAVQAVLTADPAAMDAQPEPLTKV